MRKYIKPLFLMLIFGISACGQKSTPQQQDIFLTPPAMSVTITRENCPSMEVQLGMTVVWMNGDTVHLPLQIDQYDESGKVTDTGKSEIGPGDVFATKFYYAGIYRYYCSENKDVYATITVK
jgi:hypothetical protein